MHGQWGRSLIFDRSGIFIGRMNVIVFSQHFSPEMNTSCQNPEPVSVILGGIALFMTPFLFRDSPNLIYGIVILGAGMIGSTVYPKKAGGGCCNTSWWKTGEYGILELVCLSGAVINGTSVLLVWIVG